MMKNYEDININRHTVQSSFLVSLVDTGYTHALASALAGEYNHVLPCAHVITLKR